MIIQKLSPLCRITYLSPVVAVLFFYGAYKLWMRGATKYSGTGS